MSVDQPILDQPGRASAQRALVLFVCLPIFAFTVFGLTLMLDYSSDRYAMIGLALVTAVIALVPIILDQARSVDRRHLLLSVASCCRWQRALSEGTAAGCRNRDHGIFFRLLHGFWHGCWHG